MSRKKRLRTTQSLVENDKIHSGVKKFECKYCNKIFSNASMQAQHEKTHTGKKPFKCKKCDKSYIKEYNLNKHSKVHRKLKPYLCKVCRVRFHRKDDFKFHLKQHEISFHCQANEETLESPALSSNGNFIRSSYKLRFSRNRIYDNDLDSEFTTSESEASYTSDSNTTVSFTSESNFDSSDFNESSETSIKTVAYAKNEYFRKLYDNICKNQPIVKLIRLSKRRLNSFLYPMTLKIAKVESLSDYHNRFNFNYNDIFDKEIQMELDEVYNEIQTALNGTESS